MFRSQVNRLVEHTNFAWRANSLTAGIIRWYRDSEMGERETWSQPYLVLHAGHKRCCFSAVVPDSCAHTLLPRKVRGKRGPAQPHARQAHHAWRASAPRHRKLIPNMGGNVIPPLPAIQCHDVTTHSRTTVE